MLERHIDWLARRYEFSSLDEIGTSVTKGTNERRCVALTFDDGYRDFYEHAFPLLRKKGIPSALFVVTDLVGTNNAHTHDLLYLLLTRRSPGAPIPAEVSGIPVPRIDGLNCLDATRTLIESLPASVIRRLTELLAEHDQEAPGLLRDSRSVTWAMIQRMHRSGVTIGSHTRNHILLPNESDQSIRQETAGSRQELEERISAPIHHFAYPSGAYDDVAVDAVAAAGYRFAFSTCGHQDSRHPLLTIPRTLLWERSCLDVGGKFSGPVLECLIEGAFDPISGCRQTHRRAKSMRAAA